MTYLSWFKLEGEVKSIDFKTPKAGGNQFCVIQLLGEDDQDPEIVFFSKGVDNCRSIALGDEVAISGTIGVRVNPGQNGGVFRNPQLVGNNIRRTQGRSQTAPQTPQNEGRKVVEDEDDLPF